MNHLDTPLGQVIREMREGLKPRKLPNAGAFFETLPIDGVQVTVGYDLDGAYLAATETDPAEYPQVVVVSVDLGGGPVFEQDARAWDERLNLTVLLEEQAT